MNETAAILTIPLIAIGVFVLIKEVLWFYREWKLERTIKRIVGDRWTE